MVFAHKLEDNSRKIMDISECVVTGTGKREYRTLFRYVITKNEMKRKKYSVEGYFEQPQFMSEDLKRRLIQFGVPADVLSTFLEKEKEA